MDKELFSKLVESMETFTVTPSKTPDYVTKHYSDGSWELFKDGEKVDLLNYLNKE